MKKAEHFSNLQTLKDDIRRIRIQKQDITVFETDKALSYARYLQSFVVSHFPEED